MQKKDTLRKNLKKIFLLLLLLLLAAVFLAAGRHFLRRQKYRRLITASSYDAVFFSMFPIDTYREEDFSTYGGQNLLKFSEVIPDRFTLQYCMKTVQASGNPVKAFYLGIDPVKISAEQIRQFAEMFPDCEFFVIPAYLPLETWNSMNRYEKTLKAYQDFVRELADDQSRIYIFSYFAQDWLIADPANYIGDMLPGEYAARCLYFGTLTTPAFHIREQETEFLFEEFRSLLEASRRGELTDPDLSGWDIVFLGDSVIGNYGGHYSIPGYVADFTGANTYNCGLGGSTATRRGDFSLCDMLDYYFRKDASPIPEELQTHQEMKRLLEDLESGKAGQGNRLFVLYYGLNDYFNGETVESSDPLDPCTYSGALRLAIETLRSREPDTRIILAAPNFTTYFGEGTQRKSENGGIYEEYIEAARRVAAEYQIPCLDIYHQVITAADNSRFLDGGVHPNEFGRYRIARALIQCIRDYLHR